MAKKKKRRGDGVIYSTDPNFNWSKSTANHHTSGNVSPGEQKLRIWVDRLKGNKEVTVIRGYVGNENDLKELGKSLKIKCGAGGNTKNGEILVQGNHHDKVLKLLIDMGYTQSKKAGG